MSWTIKAAEAKATIEVSATSKGDLNEFFELLKYIQRLGQVGSSRAMKVSVDGDGSARYHFVVDGKELDTGDVEVPDDDSRSFGLGG